MNQTANFQLSQWGKSDRILMEDFNSDNAKLEAALTAQRTALASKADSSALQGEHQVAQKLRKIVLPL